MVDDFDDDVQDALVPDLDLGPTAASHAQQASAAAKRGSSGPTMFDDDDAFGGAPIELDVRPTNSKPSPQITESLPADAARARSIKPGSSGAPGASAASGSLHPSLRPVAAGAVERRSIAPSKDVVEARVLGNFGDAPTALWRAPAYAWRVRKRLAELREGLALRKEDAARANAKLQTVLVALGQRAREAAAGNTTHTRALASIKAAEDLMRSRDSALATEMDAHAKSLAGLDERKRAVDAELAAAEAVERRCADDLAAAQASMQRAEAKIKSIDIEIRNAAAPRDPRRGGG